MTHVTAHLHAVKEVCATRELLQTAAVVAAVAVVVAVVLPEITVAAAQAVQERQQQRGSGEWSTRSTRSRPAAPVLQIK
jgi:hypothetical protein